MDQETSDKIFDMFDFHTIKEVWELKRTVYKFLLMLKDAESKIVKLGYCETKIEAREIISQAVLKFSNTGQDHILRAFKRVYAINTTNVKPERQLYLFLKKYILEGIY